MDATMSPEQAPQEAPEPPAPEQTDTTRSPGELFRYSEWVHVGLGAEVCADREAGCANSEHFHAWCRMPNQFQHQDIRERALASKARRIRQLRDPETDAYVVLEADLAEASHDRPAMEDELISKDWWKRHLTAMGDVEEAEEYKHIDKDRERIRELQELPDDQRPADEFGELERYFEKYNAAVEARRTEIEKPVRDAVEGLGDDELLTQLRDERIAAEGSASFMDTYAKFQWFAGTYTSADPLTRIRRFSTMEQLEESAPEIVEALRKVFGELEESLQRGHQGN
jgi:hypothetical protein